LSLTMRMTGTFNLLHPPAAAIALLLLLLSAIPTAIHALAANSKASSKKKRSTGAGFGASKTSWKVHRTDESPATKRLLEFLRSNNAEVDKVEIGFDQTTGMRGLFATKKIGKDNLVCRIPSDCVLALSDPSKQGDDAPTLAHGGANFLGMYGSDPQARRTWGPYLDTLPPKPTADEMTPDFFSDEEIELLEFPRLVERAKRRKQDIQQVANERGLDVDELRYATWLVSSRAFLITLAEESKLNSEEDVMRDERGQVMTSTKERKVLRVMVPFLDMANHRSREQSNAQLTLIDPEKDDAWFALKATRPIQPGTPVTLSYGSGIDSSVELLENYGFVDASNPIDTLMLRKGGEDAISSPDGWTTTLEEDKTMLGMLSSENEEDGILKKILTFRIKLKEAYREES